MQTPANGPDADGRNALHYAAADGDVRAVEQLLKAGSDPNAPDRNGWTPLHFAAQASAADVVSALLRAGATTEPRDAFGNTPLWRAVFSSRGQGDVIRALRAARADPLAENNSGISPVGLARNIGNFDVAQFFADVPVPPA
ncbi:ankyrin repeat domain-containing protein [Cognatilysobacter tabacisoli]|uniref:ankyrin repeat domain-containing protein n=1 Tax=Cognatilysobacter tabacisoli TaxID=2315424 RepID=UPI0018C8BBE0|nr:ankyrin repeat domain-containing protein [Lysobacter tabacisoli]